MNPITLKSFAYNVALILIMAACCIAASYVGMIAAVEELDARNDRFWADVRGGK